MYVKVADDEDHFAVCTLKSHGLNVRREEDFRIVTDICELNRHTSDRFIERVYSSCLISTTGSQNGNDPVPLLLVSR